MGKIAKLIACAFLVLQHHYLLAQLHTGTFTNNFAFSNSVKPGGGTNTYTSADGTTITFQFAWDSDPPTLSTTYDTGSMSGLSSTNFWMTNGLLGGSYTMTISFSGVQDVTALGFDISHITYLSGAGDKITLSALTESGASLTPTYTTPSGVDYTLSGNTANGTDYDSAPQFNLGVNISATEADPIASISITWEQCDICSSGTHGFGISDIEFDATALPVLDNDNDGVDDETDLDDDNDGILDEVEACGSISAPTSQEITVEVLLDYYPRETDWTLKDANGTTVLSGGNYNNGDRNDLQTATLSNALGDYTFNITDSYGDGICCSYGSGYYEIKVDGSTIIGGSSSGTGSFGASATETFNAGYTGTFTCLSGDPSADADTDGTPNYQDADFCTLNANGVCSSLDTDGDGIIDQYDVDADGDGCIDAIEGAASFTTSNIDGNNRLTGGVDADGIPTVAGSSGQGIGTSQNASSQDANCSCSDVDNDGICDLIDIDDDNDGILDEIESCGSVGGTVTQDITVEVFLDNYAEETSWTLKDASNTTLLSGGSYNSSDDQTLKSATLSGAYGEYTFEITDSYGDGICCSYGSGYYEIKVDGSTIVGGSGSGTGGFGSSGSETFSVGSTGNFLCISGDPSADADVDGTPNYQDPDFCTLNANGVCTSLDTDGDGLIDQHDLDADGDGCYDTAEAGVTGATSNGSFRDSLTTTTPADVGANGLADFVETSAESGSVNYTIEQTNSGTNDFQDAAVQGSLCQCSTVDTDGDGICDVEDIDDDNDGIPDSQECGHVQSSTFSVTNGNTETFSLPAATDGFVIEITSLDNSFNMTINGTKLVPDELQFQSNALTSTQSFVRFASDNTAFGESGNYNIWSLNYGNANPSLVTLILTISPTGNISFQGIRTPTSAMEDLIIDASDPQLNTITWNSSGTNTVVISQTVTGPTSLYASGYGLDCTNDTDNDNVPNHLDLDSDNDGIWDASEAGHGEAVDSDGRISGADTGSGTNGLFDNVESSPDNGSIDYSLADSEYSPDGIYDPYETDADGDGCYDTQEEQLTDNDSDGILGNGTPSVDANGMVTGFTYTIPTENFWQDSAKKRGDCYRRIILNPFGRTPVSN